MEKIIADECIKEIITYMKREPHSQNYTIGSLADLKRDGDLVLNPEYQRNYLQTDKEASRFVESVFLGCVIPEVQLYEDEQTSIIEVLDGQQRITSLIAFIEGNLRLTGLTTIKELNGFTYSELPKELQKRYKNYVLVSRIVKASDEEYKFFVFERLNTGSKKLLPQEIRNCIYMGNLLKMAKKLSEEPIVDNIFKFAGLTNKRYAKAEFVLRTLSISEDFPMIKGTVSPQINSYLVRGKELSDLEIESIKDKYMYTIKIISEFIGIDCMLNNKNELTKTNIEAVFINIYKYFDKKDIVQNSDKLKEAIHSMITTNQEYMVLNDKSTDSRNGIIGRTMLMYELFQDIIGINKNADKRCFELKDKIHLWYEIEKRHHRKGVKCALCNNEILNFNDCEVDHIIPWSKGGKTELENAQLVHSYCNKVKQNNINFKF